MLVAYPVTYAGSRITCVDSCIFLSSCRDHEGPVVETEGPVVETEGPVVETEGPVVETEGPVVETKGPVVETVRVQL